MTVVMQMRFRGITPEQYEEARERVRWDVDYAEGGKLHIAAFDDEGLRVTDLWESAEHFERFGNERLMPVLNEMGITQQPEVEILPLHALLVVDVEEPARA
jgi:hypothetical protein